MATKLKVTYNDDREVLVLATPRAQVEAERHFRGQGIAEVNKVEAGYFLAWASLHFTKREDNDFEVWLDSIKDVDQVDLALEDEQATDPTAATPEPTGSSV